LPNGQRRGRGIEEGDVARRRERRHRGRKIPVGGQLDHEVTRALLAHHSIEHAEAVRGALATMGYASPRQPHLGKHA
jgi:hypothetical protein